MQSETFLQKANARGKPTFRENLEFGELCLILGSGGRKKEKKHYGLHPGNRGGKGGACIPEQLATTKKARRTGMHLL